MNIVFFSVDTEGLEIAFVLPMNPLKVLHLPSGVSKPTLKTVTLEELVSLGLYFLSGYLSFFPELGLW